MIAVSSAQKLVADPVGHFVEGKSFVAWVQTAGRMGGLHLGPFDHADRQMMAELFPIVASPSLAARYDLVHDLSRVGAFDRDEFAFFENFLAHWIDQLATRVRRLAVILPGELAGATLSGMFHKWVVPRFDARLCTTTAEMFDFLAITGGERDELARLYETHADPDLRRRVCSEIAKFPIDTSIERVAAALGTSVRSLQRRLTSLGTTFRRELMATRVRLACSRLLDPAAKIETIAREVGFQSPEAFTAMFRKVMGESPSRFRSRRASV